MSTNAVIAVVLSILMFGGGWWAGSISAENSYLDKQKEDREQADNEKLVIDGKLFAAEKKASDALAAADQAYINGVNDGKKQTDRLVADLRSGNLRLSAAVKAGACGSTNTTAGSVSGNDAEARAELSTENSEFLLRIGGEADEVVKQLGMCQATVTSYKDAVANYNRILRGF
ncbi:MULTISPECIES: lysis system i-spanin subunit Rz [Yersinia]|uniref:Bacteriophage lysis protein n=1 Tax=Yersinia frederiksenii TaxID=29484 RepID=A0AAI9EMT3_YERFR|nr:MULTISPECIES: lysis system i-spanin subunit Rz [Yersinia]MDN0126849.1 lysis system i-spanin subunit Rz [Yersinia massiliensis]CFQ88137.1 Bacteriophage lysis protein [Yersinia frederiksenii]